MIPKLFSALLLAGSLAAGEPAPDFDLVDVNETSPRYWESVSPSDYLHQVSAYYFGSST